MDLLAIQVMFIELVTIVIFVFYSNNMVVVMIVVGFIAIFFVDGLFMVVSMISWPVLVILILMIGLVVNGLRVMSGLKFIYVAVMSIITPVMLFLYLLVLSLIGLVIISVVRSYFGYWVICVNIIVLVVMMYFLMDIKLI